MKYLCKLLLDYFLFGTKNNFDILVFFFNFILKLIRNNFVNLY